MKKGRATYILIRVLFFAGSLLYLAKFAHQSFGLVDLKNWLSASTSMRLVLASVLFATTAMFSVLGWRAVLAHLGQPKPIVSVAHTFCLTQIAKYVPGNVAHHIGRVAMGKSSLGIPPGIAIISILQESALACLAAVLVGAACLWAAATGDYGIHSNVALGRINFLTALTIVILAGLTALCLVNLWRKHAPANSRLAGWLLRITPSVRSAMAALPSYTAIYAVNGVALWIVASSIVQVDHMDFLLLTGAYSLSWIIGFLLPGAPGGLGVREAAMAVLLGGMYPAEAVFSISVLSRISTVFADVLIFFCGLYLAREMGRQRSHTEGVKSDE